MGKGGAVATAGPVTLQNSIVTGSTAPSCFGIVADGGHNIAFADATCPGANASPQLDPLADNGGPTKTEALAAGSPAIDAAPTGAGCPPTDQRGVARPHGTACDIGAYEHAEPDVTTDAATSIGATGATLNATVTPNGAQASYHFEYGTSVVYDAATIAHTVTGNATAAPVSALLSGLAPGVTYHYRLVATNADGSTPGPDRTFTTPTPTPTSPSPPAGGRGGAPRFLSASVNPRLFAVTPTHNATPKRAKPHAHFGTTFNFRLSEAARITITIERALPGRLIGGTCRPETKQNHTHRRCNRLITPRVFSINAHQGPNATKFSGRIGPTALPPGNYQATLIATDTASQESTRARLTFRIIKP